MESRWGIESCFRDTKYSVGLVNLHGKRDAFVEQEIYAAMIAFNFTSRVVNEVVIQQPKNGSICLRRQLQDGGDALQGISQ